jgi:DNA-binding NtrC family response regulator
MASILVVDDEEQMRTLLEMLLTRAGHEVVTASNGREGMQRYRARPMDLVITDLIMPEREGVETIIELARGYPLCKIIAMSGGGRVGSQDYLPLAGSLGAHATLAKPFSNERLLKIIQEVLALK